MAGENSTFVLRPDGGTPIPFDMTATAGVISGYVVPSGSIKFNEGDRLEVKYAEGAKTDGGRVSNARGPLARVSFDVIVSATSRAGMIAYADALFAAVTNKTGGLLEYKPDGVGAGVPATYFAYLQSAPPEAIQDRANRWDGDVDTRNGTQVYSMVFAVSLMTAPFAASDPANPTLLVDAQTVENAHDATPRANSITIPAAGIKGSVPALVRVKAAPLDGTLSRLIVARRTTGLAAFQAMYTTPTPLAPTAAWAQVNDATRCGGTYWRCSPSQNDAWFGLRFTVPNWTSHRGTAAVACIYRATGENDLDEWDMKAAWSIANTPLEGRPQSTDSLKEWRIKLLAEMDIPDAAMSSIEDMALNIDVHVRRRAGSGTLGIDAIMLLFTDEAVIDARTPADTFATTDDTILVENLDEELAHVVQTADGKLQLICNLVGTSGLIPLEAGVDNRLDFLWERAAVLFQDDFAGYGANWRGIEDFEQGSGWNASDYPHSAFCAVQWRSSKSSTSYRNGYPTDITGGGLDTAALVAAGKMRADGNDLRVLVNGQEQPRYLHGMNTSTTKVWVNLFPKIAPALTISAGIAAGGEVASITFNQAINALPSTGQGRIVMIGDELFTYTTKSDAARTIYGVKRAQFNSSAAAHSSGATAHWIQFDIRILYGNPSAVSPSVDEAYRPAFSLSSTNEVWTYTEFGVDAQTQPGGWYLGAASGWWYGGNRGSAANPWVELGMRIKMEYEQWGGSLGDYVRRALYNPCGITHANFANGDKYASDAGVTWMGRILSSTYTLSTLTLEYTIDPPATPATWESWSRSQALSANKEWVGQELQVSGGSAPGRVACLEAADCVLTLNSAQTPLVAVMPEVSTDTTTYAVEGQQCKPLTATSTDPAELVIDPPSPWPFVPGFLDFYLHLSTGAGVTAQSARVRLKTSESDYYELTLNKTQGESSEGDYFESHPLAAFSTVGTPDLDNLAGGIEFVLSSTGGTTVFYVDDVRLSAPDPGNSAAGNDTGTVWDFFSGSWHIEEQKSAGQSLGQNDSEAGAEKVALLAANYGADIQYSALVRARRDDGKVGLVFRASDATAGSEDMYALVLDTANDRVVLYEYVAGTPAEIGDAAFSCARDTDYRLSVTANGADIQCFVSAAGGDLWGNRVIQVSDTTHTAGRAGLITVGTLGRFTDVRLQGIGDRHDPDDRLQVSVWAVFRTITPFHE